MAVAAHGINGYTFKSIQLSCESKKRVSAPPIFISTNPSHVNPYHLRDLFAASNLSSHRFPSVDLDGRVEPVDIHKLRIALSHSSVVVSVFSRPQGIPTTPTTELSSESLKLGDFLQRVMPVKHSNKQLVGFGRAVSDNALTASIHDVMVIPSLRGMGIGRRIVQRIVRILTSRDIYDISALCSKNERLFFNACGFGDDTLGSTTMMYTRTVSNNPEGHQMVKRAGTNFSANEEGFQLMDHSTGRTTLANENEPPQPHPPQRPETHPQTISPYTHPIPFPSNYSNLSIGGPSYPPAGPPGYNPPRTPPPPPPPSNVGYIPTFLPRSDHVPSTYYNMPSSAAPPRGQNNGPGFGVGMGAGALAAGAVIFGDDFMSGFDFPDPSLTIYADPPF